MRDYPLPYKKYMELIKMAKHHHNPVTRQRLVQQIINAQRQIRKD